MKPFPSQTPSVFPLFTLLPIPRDDAKGEEFPIDGADNGAAKMQRPSCLFETIFRMREGWGGRRCLQLTAISQKREILYYLWYFRLFLLPLSFSLSLSLPRWFPNRIYETTRGVPSRFIDPIISDWDLQSVPEYFQSLSIERSHCLSMFNFLPGKLPIQKKIIDMMSMFNNKNFYYIIISSFFSYK